MELERPRLLLACPRAAEEDLPLAALRLVVLPLALRLVLVPERLPALRALAEAPAADRLRVDFLLFVPDFVLRDEVLLPDFPRDFLALVAIDGLLESWTKNPPRR